MANQVLVEDDFTYAIHKESGSIYRVEVLLEETFIDSSGVIRVTEDYTIL